MMTLMKTISQVMTFSSVFKNPLKPARLNFIVKGNKLTTLNKISS